MSSSMPRRGERMVHQEFIARIRYSNTLPPPPNPPKLLEIPNTGLGGGHYTTPGFASRLVRDQPLNMEADAELGMPIDLIGMPGVFDGDESSIQAVPNPPAVHPHDRALLKPLSALGKPRPSEASVSFLRRTEYISSGGALKAAGAVYSTAGRALNTSAAARRAPKRLSPEPDAGTPAYVKRKIEQSFAASAAAARDKYARVRHPTKKGLRLAAAYPLLPDLGAFPDSGAYVTIKFSNNPVVAGAARVYDTRLQSGIFKPVDPTDEERLAYETALKVWERDPQRHQRPQMRTQYDFYLPNSTRTGEAFRTTFGQAGTETDGEDEEYDFGRIRTYESVEEKEYGHTTKYAEEVLLAFADDVQAVAPDLGRGVAGGPAAVLYYPVMQRSVVRSLRGQGAGGRGAPSASQSQLHHGDDGDGDGARGGSSRVVDRLQVKVCDAPEDMREHIARIRADPLHFHENDLAEDEQEQEREVAAASSQQRRRRDDHDHDDDEDRDEDRRNGRNHHRDDDDDDDNARRQHRERSSSTVGSVRPSGHSRNRRTVDDDSDADGDDE